MLLLATFTCIWFAASGEIGRLIGVGFLVVLAAYIIYTYRSEKRAHDASARMHEGEAELVDLKTNHFSFSLGLAIIGMVMVAFGADFMVDGAVSIARRFGISEAIIGLTILAIGSSLPELATSTIAALRGQADVAFGNIVGSCIFNSIGILGVTAIVLPIQFDPTTISMDLWVMGGVTLWLSVQAFIYGQITRNQGVLYLLSFAAYMSFLFARSMAA
jgi:cation:H+ antiporter